jgi:hypothetical protein
LNGFLDGLWIVLLNLNMTRQSTALQQRSHSEMVIGVTIPYKGRTVHSLQNGANPQGLHLDTDNVLSRLLGSGWRNPPSNSVLQPNCCWEIHLPAVRSVPPLRKQE